MIKNYMEIVIEEIMEDLVHQHKYEKEIFKCSCEICMDNIKAITLNALSPFYVTCKSGEAFGNYHNKLQQNKTDILYQLMKAVKLVGENPKH